MSIFNRINAIENKINSLEGRFESHAPPAGIGKKNVANPNDPRGVTFENLVNSLADDKFKPGASSSSSDRAPSSSIHVGACAKRVWHSSPVRVAPSSV